MATLPILILPHKKLRQVCSPVEAVTDEVVATLDAMRETMYAAEGIGLAASQVGDMRRLVVVDVGSEDEEKRPLDLINPEIIVSSDDRNVHSEGCLSIPGVVADVERPAHITVRFLDRTGETHTMDCDGLLAICIQHEIDHLNGVLFIDHLSRLKRSRIETKFAKKAQA